MKSIVIKRFEIPDETREFEKGRFEIVRIGGTVIGRARYDPGWKWSEHVAPAVGTSLCQVEHVGLVITGRAAVKMEDGTELVLTPGDLFSVPPGHDSWVVGADPYVSLHLLGGESYAASPAKGRTPKQAKARARAAKKGRRRGVR